jgi:hypothetical protein
MRTKAGLDRARKRSRRQGLRARKNSARIRTLFLKCLAMKQAAGAALRGP